MKTSPPIPLSFLRRRLHSLTGLWFVIFLIFHLFTNSQAALWLGDHGKSFIRAVNSIHELPYLHFIEIGVLLLPILIHGILGAYYAWQSQPNSFGCDPAKPILSFYSRNHAYTWQRLTAWIVLLGLAFHVIQMRFMEYPVQAKIENHDVFMVKINKELDLEALSGPMKIDFFDQARIRNLLDVDTPLMSQDILDALDHYQLQDNEAIVMTGDIGTAILMVLRETFKSLTMRILYTLFVLCTCYHACNGIWTFCISWGITISVHSQNIFLWLCYGVMLVLSSLGLAAIWGS